MADLRPALAVAAAAMLAPLLPATPVPMELRQTDAQRLAGTWEVVEATYGQEELAAYVGIKWALAADGTAHRIQPDGTTTTAKWKAGTAGRLNTFDWNHGEGTGFLASYERDGDTLRVTLRTEAEGRPQAVGPTDGAWHFVFKRRK